MNIFRTLPWLAALCVSLTAQSVHASPHELYLVSGAGLFSGPSRLIAGYGGGPGYRYYFSPTLALHGEARVLGYLGNAGTISAGASYRLGKELWRPSIGLQLTSYFGSQLHLVTVTNPTPSSSLAWAVQARLSPLRFELQSAAISVLSFDLGAGVDRGHVVPALLFTLLEIGYRL